ncbi:non-homologous end-joining DNA ligase [Nocardia stercoris]|uniref:DNA ligase (ATP) n=1 Tax=Nocardia stercoris TaxID=2483361 RepID=A0A3M2LG80_9NOCA|nr:non-homologous end-joining DNA ligase [Nocardia stercoris]RMI33728.1 ATP-dependent DNA ligase [Nocardia stercoris]
MLATPGQPPVPPGRWSAEMKWDGVRAIARCTRDGISLWSRNLREITGSYPEIATALTEATAGRTLLLDGELVAPDGRGAPSFALLQRRMHVRRPTAELIGEVRVDYMVFDLLAVDTGELFGDPYSSRRAALTDLDLDDGARVRVPPSWSLADTGAEQLLQAAAEAGLEGIVSKRADSIYEPGRRSPAWIKTVLRATTEAVIVGAVPGSGPNGATFGGLVLAGHTPEGRLRCIGGVGTGFTAAARRSIRAALDEVRRDTSPLDDPPPAAVTRSAWWVEPVFVADIEYREVSADGLLRHPSFRGIRTDKTPDEVEWPL